MYDFNEVYIGWTKISYFLQWIKNGTEQYWFFFQNEGIFISLDELDGLDRITYAWILFNYSLTQA